VPELEPPSLNIKNPKIARAISNTEIKHPKTIVVTQ